MQCYENTKASSSFCSRSSDADDGFPFRKAVNDIVANARQSSDLALATMCTQLLVKVVAGINQPQVGSLSREMRERKKTCRV